MKRALLMIAILLLSVSVYAQKNPWDQNMPIKSGTVTYDITGTEKGMKILYIKDFGKYTSEYKQTVTKIMGITRSKTETLVITEPDWIYSVDYVEKTALKSVNPVKYMIEEYNKLSKADKKKAMTNAEKMGMNALKGTNGKLTRNATTILGYKCDKVEMLGVTAYTVSGTGLELQSSASMLGIKAETTATSVKTGGVPADKFSVPADFPITTNPEADQMAIDNAKASVHMLVDGEISVEKVQMPENSDDPDQPSKEDVQKILKMFGGQ